VILVEGVDQFPVTLEHALRSGNCMRLLGNLLFFYRLLFALNVSVVVLLVRIFRKNVSVNAKVAVFAHGVCLHKCLAHFLILFKRAREFLFELRHLLMNIVPFILEL
jgi:hypothetical protein